MMAMRTTSAKVLLADALVEAAHSSECVAILIQVRRSEDVLPWCLDCRDAEGCWAWGAMTVLSWQEIQEAKHRLKMNRQHKWACALGGRPADPIRLVESSDRIAA